MLWLLTLLQMLRSLLGRPPRVPTRLTEGEVIASARQALQAGGLLDAGTTLFVSEVARDTAGDVVWTVMTATVGSGAVALVEDRSGEVREARRWGIR
jgi:hypothetical protein